MTVSNDANYAEQNERIQDEENENGFARPSSAGLERNHDTPSNGCPDESQHLSSTSEHVEIARRSIGPIRGNACSPVRCRRYNR